jgi:hypothetical protein
VAAADVQVERLRRTAEQMVVDRGNLEPVLDQLRNDRIDLSFEQQRSPITMAPP